MTPADLPCDLVAAACCMHVSRISLAISARACDAALDAMAIARAGGGRISFELSYRSRLWPVPRALALTCQVLQHCDIFFPSADEIVQLTGIARPEDIIQWAHDHGSRAVVPKLGAAEPLPRWEQVEARMASNAP